MLSPEPGWTVRTQAPLTQWYGNVRLLADSALGQWVRIGLDSGELVWERSYPRANHVCGVTSDTIVATEMYSGGPWTSNFGVYGINLADGEPLWVNHGARLNGLMRALDHVGMFANRWRDSPELVTEEAVWTYDGRVLDPRTGSPLDPAPAKPPALADKSDPSRTFYYERRLPLSQGRSLIRIDTSGLGTLSVALSAPDGTLLWRRDWPRGVRGNYYSHRIVGDHLVVMVNGAESALEVVRLGDGDLIQHLRCAGSEAKPARIEDADERGVLISDQGHVLRWYPLLHEGLYRSPAP